MDKIIDSEHIECHSHIHVQNIYYTDVYDKEFYEDIKFDKICKIINPIYYYFTPLSLMINDSIL